MDSQHGRKLMEYIAFISESLEHEINSMKGRHGGGLGAVEFVLQVNSSSLIVVYVGGKGWLCHNA